MGTKMELENRIEKLLNAPYWVVDFLPETVPPKSPGQFSRVEEYFLKPARLLGLRERLINVLLKLNCYYDFAVCLEAGESAGCEGTWRCKKNPSPEKLRKAVLGGACLSILIDEDDSLITVAGEELCMTLYNPGGRLITIVRKLVAAEGLFLRPGEAGYSFAE